jgi:hypothetical protein
MFINENDIQEYNNKIKLISWNDWQDNDELSIIIDQY